jgi:hypothetical protein
MAGFRFAIGMQSEHIPRDLDRANIAAISPYLGYHHYLMIFAALAVILLCTSPSIPPDAR